MQLYEYTPYAQVNFGSRCYHIPLRSFSAVISTDLRHTLPTRHT